jgi:hypothetical protein
VSHNTLHVLVLTFFAEPYTVHLQHPFLSDNHFQSYQAKEQVNWGGANLFLCMVLLEMVFDLNEINSFW